MLHVRARQSFMALSDRCSVLVFHIAAVFALIHSCRGHSEVVGPLQPVVALIGDDIMLPCTLDPLMDAFEMTVEWTRPDLDPRFVLVWRDGVDIESKKHPSYTSRTSLFTDELKNGNISLKISKVKLSDEGTYRCFVPELNKHTTVQLVVGAASSPTAEINSTISSSTVVLQCESAGWYPEPELLWLDGEGKLLSAGPTETLRGPDDLYTVSSRVTVEKRHSNNITCRVQQRNTNQSRETHIHVPDDFFVVTSPPNNPANDPSIIIGSVISALFVLILILTVVFVVWKKRRAKGKKKKSEEDGDEQAGKKKTISSKNENIGSQKVEGESEPLMTGREEERELKIRIDNKDQHHTERENQRDKMGTKEGKREEQRSQTESRISSVSSKVPLNTDVKIQDKTRGQNQEKQPEETSQQSREEIREQPEKLRGAERKGGGQGEELGVHGGLRSEEANRKDKEREKLQLPHEGDLQVEQQVNVNEKEQPEESVSVTERGVDCVEDKQEEDQMEVDIQSRKHTQEITLQQAYTLPVKKEEMQARKQNFKKVKKCGNKQNDQFVEVDDAAHSQNARTAQLYENIQWTKDQQKLLVQTELQECLKENVEDLEDQMEAEEYSGLQFPPFTEEHKEKPMSLGEEKSFNFSFHLSTDQEPWRDKETQQQLLVEKIHRERNVDMKESDTEKKRAEENSDEGSNLYPVFMAQQETERKKLEAEQQREENQRRLQSETRRERENDERELKIRKDNKNQHHTEEKTVRKNQRVKKIERENQKDKMGMTERKREEQRSQTESRISSVSSKDPLNTDVKIQDKTRGQNQEKQPEETSQQSREEIREQPEKLRGAERKGGGQREELGVHGGLRSEETNREDKEREKLQLPHEGDLQVEQQVNKKEKEQPEESVSVTERGVDCVEDKQEEELLGEASDFDQKNNQSRKHTQEMNLQDVCTVPIKRQKVQEERRASKHQRKKTNKYVKKQNDDHMEVDDAANSQNAATSQLYENIQWTNCEQKLTVQTEPQECLKDDDDDLEDQMEMD